MKTKSPRLGKFVDGTPIALMKHGEIDEGVMHGMQISHEDLEASARLKGIASLDKAQYPILERKGGSASLNARTRASENFTSLSVGFANALPGHGRACTLAMCIGDEGNHHERGGSRATTG